MVQIKEVGMSEWSTNFVYDGSGGGVWTRPWLDLEAYAGKTVQVGFRYLNRNGDTAGRGWFVDQVWVETSLEEPRSYNPEGFELGLGDWCTESGYWEVGSPASGPATNVVGARVYEGTNCAGTVLAGGTWYSGADSRLVSPPFVVPSADLHPRFRFWHWYDLNRYGDSGMVQIKEVGMSEWSTNFVYDGSGGGVWTQPELPLGAYAGKTVQVGFRYLNRNGDTAGRGWFVDYVRVETDGPPAIIHGPTSLVVTQGQPAVFVVVATGSSPLSYQWSLDVTDLTNDRRISGATGSILQIADVQLSDAGTYCALVSNSAGSTSACATLSVLVPPSVTVEPPSQIVLRGSNATFTALASGTEPLLYQWRLNGSNLTNGGAVSGVTTPTLSIVNVQTNDAGLYDVVVSNPVGVTNSAPAELRVLIVPLPWTNHDVGDVGRAGSASYSDGVFTVTGSGEDSEGTADAFHFVHQTLTGDGQIVARLLTLQGDDPAAEAGVMIRETLTPGSCHVLVAANSDKETVFRRRLITDDYSVQNLHQGTNYSWLRLMRMGDMFVGHVSTNGLDWEYAWFTTMNLTAQVEIGLAVTAHSFGALATAEFDNVIVTNLTPIPGPWLLPGPRIYLGGEGVTPASLHAQGGFKMLLGSEVDDQLEVLASPEIMTGGPPEHQVLDKTTFTSLGRVTNTLGVVPFLDTRALTNANPSFYLLRKVEP
jgi:hypothetical protein